MLSKSWIVVLLVSCSVMMAASYQTGQVVGKVDSKRLTEISGIVASRRHQEVFWVHNDSGDAPYVYAINRQGSLLGTFKLAGASAVDWEDIAWGRGEDCDYLYLADIGDNWAKRRKITVYRVAEPNIALAQADSVVEIGSVESYDFTYPDGPHDAETLIIDPLNGDLYLITKRQLRSKLYRGRLSEKKNGDNQLEFLGLLPVGYVVAGDISNNGDSVVLRTLTEAWVWTRPENTSMLLCFSGPSDAITLLPEPQGEAICFSSTSKGVYTISEGKFPRLLFYAENTPQ